MRNRFPELTALADAINQAAKRMGDEWREVIELALPLEDQWSNVKQKKIVLEQGSLYAQIDEIEEFEIALCFIFVHTVSNFITLLWSDTAAIEEIEALAARADAKLAEFVDLDRAGKLFRAKD